MSNNYAISLKRSTALLAALAFFGLLTVVNFASFLSGTASAAQLTARSLTLSSTLAGSETGDGVANSETNGSDATHTIRFTSSATTSTGATFQYCTTAIGTCTAPTGLVLTAASAGTHTNASGTIDDSGSTLTLTGTVTASTNVAVVVENIVNPTDIGTFFVRILIQNDGPTDDDGTVASAITEGIFITARVAETLGFSTTADMTTGGVVPENGTTCDPLEGSGAIQLGDPANENTLSIATAWDAWSAFRLYTNSSNGVVVQYAGETLTKGTDSIEAIGATAEVSTPGTEQFGLAIAQTANGQNTDGFANVDDTWPGATAGRLTLATEYDGGDGAINGTPVAAFAYDDASPTTPKTLASTAALDGGYVECDTAAVRYIGNINPLTAAGTYTTTVVYYAVPTY